MEKKRKNNEEKQQSCIYYHNDRRSIVDLSRGLIKLHYLKTFNILYTG